ESVRLRGAGVGRPAASGRLFLCHRRADVVAMGFLRSFAYRYHFAVHLASWPLGPWGRMSMASARRAVANGAASAGIVSLPLRPGRARRLHGAGNAERARPRL